MMWVLIGPDRQLAAQGSYEAVIEAAVDLGWVEWVYSVDGTARRPKWTVRGPAIAPVSRPAQRSVA